MDDPATTDDPTATDDAVIERRLRSLWDRVLAKRADLSHFLTQVRLQGIRGIDDLAVGFISPVVAIAGGNASGKSTVLAAIACAYQVPGARHGDFLPATLFADYRPRLGTCRDVRGPATIEFEYATPSGGRAMRWRRTSGWRRTFYGRRNASQPERPVYMHVTKNLDDPSVVRDSVASMTRGQSATQERPLTLWEQDFAEKMLPFRYSRVTNLTRDGHSLLFARQKGGAAYSELHMAAGERAILRLSQEIAHLDDALVLIDQVEVGLHPWVQQLLMLHLQELAVLNDLQIIVTTHSPVVLESIHPLGRVFLERDAQGRVEAVAPYRDIVQDALYGRSRNALSFLCEDDTAEAILQGVFDVLYLRLRIRRECVRIGTDANASECPGRAATFTKFGEIRNFVFVLGGNRRDTGVEAKIADGAGRSVATLFLPGDDAPAVWVWRVLRRRLEAMADQLPVDAGELADRMDHLDAVYDRAREGPSAVAEVKLRNLADPLAWDATDLCQVVARVEAGRRTGECQTLMKELEQELGEWRQEYV